eukprot:9292072-Prorocentrum_lima.AAC.1
MKGSTRQLMERSTSATAIVMYHFACPRATDRKEECAEAIRKLVRVCFEGLCGEAASITRYDKSSQRGRPTPKAM